MNYYLGVDLGGTNIAAGLVDESFQIIDKEKVKTRASRSFHAICEEIAALCGRILERNKLGFEDIPWIGIGTPGIVWDGVVYYSSNLKFSNTPLAKTLSEIMNRPVFVENDANTAAYGEYIAGAGQGSQSMVVMTIGTGIGSGIILDGTIHTGFNGAAAELGHIIVQPGGRDCPCGRQGCLEQYCSGTSLKIAVRNAVEADPNGVLARMCGGDPRKASAKAAFLAYKQGDAVAVGIIEEFLHYLSVGASTAINLIQPEVFCIGGGLSQQGEVLTAPLREKVEKLLFSGRDDLRTKIVTATLGNDAGILGASMLGNQ